MVEKYKRFDLYVGRAHEGLFARVEKLSKKTGVSVCRIIVAALRLTIAKLETEIPKTEKITVDGKTVNV